MSNLDDYPTRPSRREPEQVEGVLVKGANQWAGVLCLALLCATAIALALILKG